VSSSCNRLKFTDPGFTVELPFNIADTRDVTSFPDCEARGQKRFVEFLQCGENPNVRFSWYTLSHEMDTNILL
jgi:hypothetical protein